MTMTDTTNNTDCCDANCGCQIETDEPPSFRDMNEQFFYLRDI